MVGAQLSVDVAFNSRNDRRIPRCLLASDPHHRCVCGLRAAITGTNLDLFAGYVMQSCMLKSDNGMIAALRSRRQHHIRGCAAFTAASVLFGFLGYVCMPC